MREESVGFAVQPLQILEQELHRLIAAFAREQFGDRIEGPVPPNARVHLRQCRIGLADAEQTEQVRHRVLEPPIERQHLAQDPFAAPPLVIVRRDLEVVP